MSDDHHDDPNNLADPFGYEDLLTQRAMAFYQVAKLTETIKDETAKDLCLTMLRKLNASVKAPQWHCNEKLGNQRQRQCFNTHVTCFVWPIR